MSITARRATLSLVSGTPRLDDAALLLSALYVRFRAAAKEDPALEQEGRAWFKRLEDGDPDARALWQRFRDVSWAEFQAVYEILGIEYDEVRGESAYEPDMPRILDALAAKDLSQESQGALVVVLPGEDNPILLRTRDGTSLYATRDTPPCGFLPNSASAVRCALMRAPFTRRSACCRLVCCRRRSDGSIAAAVPPIRAELKSRRFMRKKLRLNPPRGE